MFFLGSATCNRIFRPRWLGSIAGDAEAQFGSQGSRLSRRFDSHSLKRLRTGRPVTGIRAAAVERRAVEALELPEHEGRVSPSTIDSVKIN
jgi:hypothetical protein